jgi:transcriptional regulator with XRE-family HTH domain
MFARLMARKARGLTKSLHLPAHRALCDLLVAARQNAGLTQQIVAKRLKRPQSFVAKYEGGERRIDILEFLEIAAALNADPVALLRSLQKAARRTIR